MSTHNICFSEEIRKYQYFLIENKHLGAMKVWTVSSKNKESLSICESADSDRPVHPHSEGLYYKSC